mmetsp:Transcript_15865/g.60439  ORF Transcript_15865/g.60439 Transcript_15865/m.60439 type:complete len:320 (-) Transcript_15865:1031-1990(-)
MRRKECRTPATAIIMGGRLRRALRALKRRDHSYSCAVPAHKTDQCYFAFTSHDSITIFSLLANVPQSILAAKVECFDAVRYATLVRWLLQKCVLRGERCQRVNSFDHLPIRYSNAELPGLDVAGDRQVAIHMQGRDLDGLLPLLASLPPSPSGHEQGLVALPDAVDLRLALGLLDLPFHGHAIRVLRHFPSKVALRAEVDAADLLDGLRLPQLLHGLCQDGVDLLALGAESLGDLRGTSRQAVEQAVAKGDVVRLRLPQPVEQLQDLLLSPRLVVHVLRRRIARLAQVGLAAEQRLSGDHDLRSLGRAQHRAKPVARHV